MEKSVSAIDALIAESKDHIYIDPLLAEKKATEALELSTSIRYDVGRFESLFVLSRISHAINRNADAINTCEECLKIAEKLKDYRRIALAKNAIGIAYSLIMVNSKALEQFLEALEIAKKHAIGDVECRIHNNIASVFSDIKDFNNSLKYLHMAYEKARYIGEPVTLYLRNIANSYLDLENYDKAYEYCMLARNANWREKDQDVWADIYFILSIVLAKKGKRIRAHKACELALKLSEKYHNFFSRAEGFIGRAKLFMEEGRNEEALASLDETLKISEQYGFLELFQQSYKLYAEISRTLNNPDSENQALRAYMAITEKLTESEYDKKRAYAVMQLTLFNIQKEHQNLKDQADKDPLTGCLTYRDFEAKITTTLEKYQQRGAMLFFDVDNLKLVNDRYGHHAGDKLIIEFAAALNKVFKDKGLMFRKGGDEFVIFLPGMERKEVTILLEEMFSLLAKPRIIGKSLMPLSCSIGVALAPQDSSSVKELEGMADKAMYQAKNMGKRCYCFYSPQ
ncbi:MAG: diguanylate cyclase [Clostridia bacterium]|nr:diguanylate cyclase [Clostridia bacterium]